MAHRAHEPSRETLTVTGNDTKRQRKERKPHRQPLASLWAGDLQADGGEHGAPGAQPPGASTLFVRWRFLLDDTAQPHSDPNHRSSRG